VEKVGREIGLGVSTEGYPLEEVLKDGRKIETKRLGEFAKTTIPRKMKQKSMTNKGSMRELCSGRKKQ